jgi:hypothetical protein
MNPLISKFLQDHAGIPFHTLTIPKWEFTTTYAPHICADWEINAYQFGFHNTYIAQLELHCGLLKMPWGTHRIIAVLPLVDGDDRYIGYSMRDALYRIELLWATVKALPIELMMRNPHIEIEVDNLSLFMDLWEMYDSNTMNIEGQEQK